MDDVKGLAMQYKDIADKLAALIARSMRPGDRLPGVRELAQSEQVSLVTARNAYLCLKERGIISVRQGSGTFVRPVGEQGHTDFARIGPPDELLMWAGKYLVLPIEGLLEYDPPQGYEPLRQRAGQWLQASGIMDVPLITSGSQQAIFLSGMAILKKGDVVVVEDPCYRGAVRIFESLGAEVRTIGPIQTEEDLRVLEDEKIRLLYIMPQGHFPTGLSMPEPLRRPLIDLAERRDFFIIEDDPVSELIGRRPLKSMDYAGRVIYTKSLSNILGPGLRIGFSVFPQGVLDTVVRLKEINDLSISSMIQRMLYAMMSSSDFPAHILSMKVELEARQAMMKKLFGLTVQGLCMWAKAASSGRIVAERLLKDGIRIMPGDIYGPAWADHVRISLLRAPRSEFFNAMATINKVLSGSDDTRLMNLI